VHADWRTAPLTARQRALADYASTLTLEPWARPVERIAALRDAGFADDAILAATEVVGYFNFVNRMASGLGVELEDREA
jgi:uncharacterized peroxidase-related enzyme